MRLPVVYNNRKTGLSVTFISSSSRKKRHSASSFKLDLSELRYSSLIAKSPWQKCWSA